MRHARNHWKRFDNVREALAPAIERRGYFPTQAELRKQRLSSVWDAMKKYHGGYHADQLLEWVFADATLFLARKKEVWETIRNSPRRTLARRYGTPLGRYNRRAKKKHGV